MNTRRKIIEPNVIQIKRDIRHLNEALILAAKGNRYSSQTGHMEGKILTKCKSGSNNIGRLLFGNNDLKESPTFVSNVPMGTRYTETLKTLSTFCVKLFSTGPKK